MAADQHISDLAEYLFQFQRDGHLCDVTLVAKNGQLRAHSVVLAAASDVLREALCSNCNNQSAERRFLLPWLELDELQIAIQLIYSGTVAVPPNYTSPTCLAKVFSSLKELGLKLPTSQKSLGSDDDSTDQSGVLISVKSSQIDGQQSSTCQQHSQLNESAADMIESVDWTVFGKRQLDVEKDDDDANISSLTNDFINEESDKSATFASDAFNAKPTRRGRGRGRATRSVAASLVDDTKPPCLCDTCGKEFTNVAYLVRHARTHTGELPYTCGDCGRQFRHTANLQRHQKMHTGEKPHVCDLCGAGFIQNVMLLDHRSRHHLESVDLSCPPFLCRMCGERFLTTHRLRTHKALSHRRLQRSVVRKLAKSGGDSDCIADNGRMYECLHCAELFESKVSLSLHMRRHVVKKPFECTVCSCAFDTNFDLGNHMHRHMTNWPPTVKPEDFGASSSSTSSNADAESDVRHQPDSGSLFECTVCGKQVKQLAHLKSHMMMHTGERPYKCLMCDKAYRSKFDLRLHCLRIHRVQLPAGRGHNVSSSGSNAELSVG